MNELYGQCQGPLVMVHGGAGPADPDGDKIKLATRALREVAQLGFGALQRGDDQLQVVVECLKRMERHDHFNAGRGAVLQADGQPRLTAAIMDSREEKFSGVISATDLLHPSDLAKALQNEDARVLTNPGIELLARRLGIPVESPLTPARVRQWTERAEAELDCDTVGCLVRTSDGTICVGTSTGGRGYEFPGRVSDSATVAGTYCTKFVAIGATGVGEQIVDDALAARIETRCRDGMALEEASHKCLQEAVDRNRQYGWVAADAAGEWGIAYTTRGMSYIVQGDGDELAASGQ